MWNKFKIQKEEPHYAPDSSSCQLHQTRRSDNQHLNYQNIFKKSIIDIKLNSTM